MEAMSTQQEYTTGSEGGDADAATAARNLKRGANEFMDHLKGEPPPLDKIMFAPFKKKFEPAIAVYAWNKLTARQQSAVVAANSSTSEDDIQDLTASIDVVLDLARTKRENVRKSILGMCMEIVKHLPVDAIRLFRMYITLRKLPSESGTTHPRKSLSAFSNRSDASKGEIKDTLTGNNIHWDMFTRGDFREQEFWRFEFPDTLGTNLPLSYNDAVTDLETVVDFLMIAKPKAREDVTQALFSLVMEKILGAYSTEHGVGNSGGQEGLVVVPVTGMESIDVDVTIGADYLQRNAEIRAICKKRAKPQRQGTGDMDTILSIKSDLVVCPKSVGSANLPKAKRQKEQFTKCDLNIEMKRFRWLINSENQSELTQVCAESLARKSVVESPQVLYSLLTDSCGFYGVCHVVKPANESDEYWVSRQVQGARNAVAMIRWLLQKALTNEIPDLKPWFQDSKVGAGNGESAGGKSGGKRSGGDGDVAANKEKKKKGGGDGGGEGQSTGGQVARLTMEHLWGNGNSPTVEEREEIETDWSVFYGQQLQRQTGPAFQFSGDFLGSGIV